MHCTQYIIVHVTVSDLLSSVVTTSVLQIDRFSAAVGECVTYGSGSLAGPDGFRNEETV